MLAEHEMKRHNGLAFNRILPHLEFLPIDLQLIYLATLFLLLMFFGHTCDKFT